MVVSFPAILPANRADEAGVIKPSRPNRLVSCGSLTTLLSATPPRISLFESDNPSAVEDTACSRSQSTATCFGDTLDADQPFANARASGLVKSSRRVGMLPG